MKKSRFVLVMILVLAVLAVTLWMFGCFTNQMEVGNVISFGGIEWRVLDVQDDRALLLSEYLLEEMRFHNTSEEVTWETSDIRSWLNNEFYFRFTQREMGRIAETNVISGINPRWGTHGGNDTVDKIFLLSFEEIIMNFVEQELWEGFDVWNDTRFDNVRIATVPDGHAGHWWLRSAGEDHHAAGVVAFTGQVGGFPAMTNGVFVRPAMWIYIN